MTRSHFALWSTTALTAALIATPALSQTATTDQPTPPAAGQAGGPPANTTGTEPTVADSTNAATNAAAADQSIVVTGIRRSLQSAQNIRKNSQQIVDAVVAEDIGKLPDLNTAQTAARIPGVQVYRQGGEASNVLVRGLPDYTTTYNGREIFTAETRVVALQDFPSSNIAALEVYKTSSADLVEPGLAGLINVRSRRPFDFSGGQFAGSVWALHTRQGDKTDPNFNLLATDRWTFGDGSELGALINFSRTSMRYEDAEISNTDFLQTFDLVGNQLVGNPFTGTAARLPDIQRLFYRSGKRVRPSVNAAVQFKPSPDLELYGEFLWQGFRNKIDDRLLAAELYRNTGATNLVFRPGTNLLESGTFTLPGQSADNSTTGGLFSFQGGTFNKTDTYQYAGGTRYTHGPLKLTVDIAHTKSTFKGSTESLDRRWIDASTINVNTDSPELDISGVDFSDPAAQQFMGLFEENQRSTGSDWQLRTDAQYDFSSPFLKNFQAGIRYTARKAGRFYSNRFGGAPAGFNASDLPVDFDVFNGVNFGGITEWAAPTYNSIRNNVADLREIVGFNREPIPAGELYLAAEKNLAGYGQLNLGNDVIDGTIGVRVSRVRTRVTPPNPTGVSEIDNGSKRTVVLPNASIRARLNPTVQLRAAISKTRTLPNFADLNPNFVLNPPSGGGTVGTSSDPYTASGGNPFLKPFTSWNLDAAAEFYFARTGFVSITGFHRKIKGFIQQNTFDINDPTLGVIRLTGPVNTGKGHISGVEVQGQAFADYDWVPDWARGFGVQANLTYINAKTQQPDGAGGLTFQPITDQLNGVSKWNYNLVGIYERYGFSARLTYNGRSSFRATQQFRCCGAFGDTYTEIAHPAGRLDLSLNYDVNNRFTVFGDWTNITRKTFHQNFTSGRNGAPEAEFLRYRRYDESTLSLGIRFKFDVARAQPAPAPVMAPPPPPPVEAPPVVEQPAPPPPPPPPASGERGQ